VLARGVLGLDLLRWQRFVLDRGLERDGRRWRWRTVVVTVARQNGKSALLRALVAHRLAGRRGETIGALSHLRSVGREIMFDPIADAFTGRRLVDLFDAHATRSNGSEALTLRATGGRLVIPSSSERGGHGYSLDLAIVDEAWAMRDYRVPQAITPTQIARPDPQLWVVSTAGTSESLWLRELVEAGRAGADRVALFEWSAPPELDAADVAAWEAANPAMGETIGIEELAHAWATSTTAESRAEFERAHLNRWTAGVEAIIEPGLWRAGFAPEIAIGPELVIGFDVSLDRSRASICAAGVVGDRVAVELIATRPGTDWLGPALAELRARWAPLAVVGHEAGPARSIVEELVAGGAPIEAYKAGAYAAACQVLYDLVGQGRLAHRGQIELDEAARCVGRRKMGDSWTFGRAVSSADISPLVAATLAAHRVSRPRVVPRIVI
jgi:phage terminase large subunit-like protein